MANPVKILEISGADWAKGISTRKRFPLGGLFQDATNFDPFVDPGVWVPMSSPTKISAATVTKAIQYFAPGYNDSSAFHVLGFADNGTVYDINTTAGTATDQSSRTQGFATIRGAAKFKSRNVYASDTAVLAGISNETALIAIGSEVTLLTGLQVSEHVMEIAPDRNLYFTNKQYIGRITSVSGTTNNASQFLTFEDNVVTRDLTTDGQHLIIVGDTNPDISVAGHYRCFVAFWNMKSQDLTRIWDFRDGYIVGVGFSEGEVIVYAKNNIYKCSVGSAPTPLTTVFSNTRNTLADFAPTNASQIIEDGTGKILWGGGSNTTGVKISGYGRSDANFNKVFFKSNDFLSTLNVSAVSALFLTGGQRIWAGVSGVSGSDTGLYRFSNSPGSGGNTSTITLAGVDFNQPYQLAFVKVVLDDDLESGESVDLEVYTANESQTVIKRTVGQDKSFSHTNFGAKRSHLFYPYPDGTTASSDTFEDLTEFTIINNGALVRKVEVWGYPVNPSQAIR